MARAEPAALNAAANPRILVIRRDNIGDLVCTTPLIAALRVRYPAGHIAALVNSYNAAVLDGNPDLDTVYVYTKLKHRDSGQGWFGIVLDRLRLFARLRRERFDYVVLAKSGFDRHGLALASPLRPRHIVGFAPPGERRGRAITVPVPPPANAELHEVEVMMQLAAPLGIPAHPGPVRVYPSAERTAEWRARLPELAQSGRQRWIAVHISTRVPGRRWPVERFAELIGRLASPGNTGIVLLWAPGGRDDPRHPGDDEDAAAIARLLRPGTPMLAARTGRLDELIAILGLCDGFIGVDGGAMHIAAGLGLPVVALFENLPYKKRHWHPWQVLHEMVCPETRDIADISVDQVAQAWARLAQRIH